MRYFILLLAFVLIAQQSPHLSHIEQFGDSLFSHGSRDRSPKEALSLSHEIYGFVPYWEASYSCPRWDLVSRMAYFNFTVNASGYVTDDHTWYSSSCVDDALAAGVAVDLCIAIFDDASINSLLSSATSRGRCISNALDAVIARGGSGVNLDLELPGGSYSDELVVFCSEFRDSIDARLPGGWLSICLPAVDWSGAFDVDQLALYCDALFIMGYDYYWSGSSRTGPVDPLDDPTETYDIAHTIDTYAVNPYTRSKLILGLPLYGREWPCSGSSRGASTTGSASAILYTTAISNGITYGRNWDSNANTPWYVYGSYYQGWYSDTESLRDRYQYAKTEGVQGIGWWALGYDDGALDFWAVVEDEFTGAPPDSSDTITVDDGDPGFSESGTSWIESSYGSSGWGADYDYASTGGGLDIAYFTPNILTAGDYYIYMHWVASSNRASAIPVSIEGTESHGITVDQYSPMAEASWHYLGRYHFSAGSSGYVSISDEGLASGSVIIADAVRWVLAEPLTVESPEAAPEKIDVHVYPNPFNSKLSVHLEFTGIKQLSVFDIDGRLVHNQQITGNSASIDATGWSSGIYIMYIISNSGQTIKKRAVLIR